ncbi:MAG: DUF819 family protein [Prevotellaceae bacterium]|jgi:uncharacterized membrane protein|nr:DUF819 family protein [Prevotellaceae bacterium]
MLLSIFSLLLYIATPVLILRMCKKFKSVQKIGEVLVAYFAGVFFALVIWLFAELGVLEGERLASLRKLQSGVCDLVIPFAIPLMLFSGNFRHLKAQLGGASRALLTGLVAVVCMTVIGSFIFHPYIPDMWKIAGLIAGVETGGTPNMVALQFALKVPENTFMQLQASDMLVCFFYLLFLFSIGKVLLRKFLPKYKAPAGDSATGVSSGEGAYYFMHSRHGLLQMLKSLGVSAAVVLLSIGFSMLLFGEINVPCLMLALTTLSIAASFVKPVQKLRYSFDVGMFLVLIFNVAIASMVDFTQFFNAEIYYIAGYVFFCVFGSLLLHALLCKLCKVDADTFMVSSTALINSPPFVPVVAAAIGNRQVILIGISVGMVGYAVGNYLGFIVAEVMSKAL